MHRSDPPAAAPHDGQIAIGAPEATDFCYSSVRCTSTAAVDEHKLRRIIEAFPRAPRRAVGGRVDSSRFVFIVGLPRSGTTLLERILTGLPGVRSNGETDHFARTLLSASPMGLDASDPGSLDVFARAAAADWDAVARGYAQLADPGGAGGVVIEKQPMNYQSAAQVRRPIYRSSTGRWRRFRTHLEPLIEALRHHRVRLTDLD